MIRMIAQHGVMLGEPGDLYIQGEAAYDKISILPPYRRGGLQKGGFHFYCSRYNAGADELSEELSGAFPVARRRDGKDRAEHERLVVPLRRCRVPTPARAAGAAGAQHDESLAVVEALQPRPVWGRLADALEAR